MMSTPAKMSTPAIESTIPSATGQPDDAASLRSQLDEMNARIAELAYYKAESRGFAPGNELEDWIEAEKEVCGGSPGM